MYETITPGASLPRLPKVRAGPVNGWELAAGVDEQEQVILRLAAGTLLREEFTAWVQSHLRQRASESPAAD